MEARRTVADLQGVADGEPGAAPVMTARALVKDYPGTRALDHADFDLLPSEIHTLVGSNGAGKSTLVKILSGREKADSGELYVARERVDHGHANFLTRYSIGYVSQEGSLDPEMTGYENIFLGRELKRLGLVSYRTMRRRAEALVEEFGFDIAITRRVRDLSPPERKAVEILRALALRPRVLILDEPTAAIPRPDIDHLLSVMRSLRSRTSIVFISHYMEEIFAVSDRITVLRDGKPVWVGPAAETTPDGLVAGMLGQKAFDTHQAVRAQRHVRGEVSGEIRLRCEGLRTRDGVVTDATISVASGEIVGLFGMVGAGKTELLEALNGERRFDAASLEVGGRPGGRWSVRTALARGVALVPEDRLKNALVASETGGWNLAAPHWRSSGALFARLKKLETTLAERAKDLVTIRGDLAHRPVATLSGGNKQKVAVTRWLVTGTTPAVLLLDEPTQGLDVVAREEIYQLIRTLADGGAGVLLATSDLDEAITACDNVVVIKSGTTRQMSADQQTRDSLLLEATSETSTEKRSSDD